jgi:hypothetical protein
MTHLTPDELIDAVEDALDSDQRRHLAICETCRASVADLERLLQHTRHVPVPDPSPRFWDHFSARVRAAIATEGSPAQAVPFEWLRWRVLVPVSVLALLVATLTLSIPRALNNDNDMRPTLTDDRAETTPLDAAPPIDEDVPWTFVTEVVGDVSLDEAQLAGLVIVPGMAERAVDALTPAERDELLRLLNLALAQPES